MTETECIGAVKAMLSFDAGDTAEDARLALLLEECRGMVSELTGGSASEVPDWLVIRMVRELYVRLGAEGVASRETGTVRESYLTGAFSPEVTGFLNRYRRIRTPARTVPVDTGDAGC